MKLLPFVFIAVCFIVPYGYATEVQSLGSGNWSDPSIWSTTVVPQENDRVVISANTSVLYDQNSSVHITDILVDGILSFSREINTSLRVGSIIVRSGGYLDLGNTTNPIPSGVISVITLQLPATGQSNPIVLVTAGGRLSIHGRPMQYTWTKLAQTVNNTNIITVDDNVDWNVGDEIVIGSSSLRQMEFEKKTITAISGKTITLDSNLNYEHTGEFPEKTEVIHLTRNVVIRSGDVIARGHTKYLENSAVDIRFAQFDLLGPRIVGGYPLHFHIARDTMNGSVVYGNSVTNSDNKWITVHSSIGINVSQNVGFNASGHGYFLEVGDEYGNTLENNVGIFVRSQKGVLVTPDDATPAIFWIQNGDNVIRKNVASSSDHDGFWYHVPESNASFTNPVISHRSVPITIFEENVAHSNRRRGLDVEPQYNPAKGEFKNFYGWRNEERGVWARVSSKNVTYSGGIIFGNPIGMTFPSRPMSVKDVLLYGELDRVFSENKAATYPNAFKGFEFYDGPINVTNITAKNHFSSTANYKGAPGARPRVASDVGIKEDNRFHMDSDNLIQDSQLLSPIPFFLQPPVRTGEMEAVIRIRNVTESSATLYCITSQRFNIEPDHCTFNSNWNAFVCTSICDDIKTVPFSGTLTDISGRRINLYLAAVRNDILERRVLNSSTYAGYPDISSYALFVPKNKVYDLTYYLKDLPVSNTTNVTLANYNISTGKANPFFNYTELKTSEGSSKTFSLRTDVSHIVLSVEKKPINVTYLGVPLQELPQDLPAKNSWYYRAENKSVSIYTAAY